jgi:transcriptional regulator with GAF, ATPase, and Fis domain
MGGRWQVIERFAAGPAGADGGVATAERVRLEDGRDALLKRFAPPAPAAFRAEIECLARVRSLNVTALIDAGVDPDGSPWLLREFVVGTTLRAVVRDLDPERRAALLDDVLSGLAALHREGLVHADLKPENVLVAEHGPARLTDFGLAGAVAGAARRGGGSAFYVAPERLLGWPIDARADLFAFGVLLFELIGGRLPDDAARFYARFPREPFVACVELPSADPRALEIVRRCTQVDALLRPASVAALRRELAAAGLVRAAAADEGAPQIPDDLLFRAELREVERALDSEPSARLLIRLDAVEDAAALARAVAIRAAVRGVAFVASPDAAAAASTPRSALLFSPVSRDRLRALAPRLARGDAPRWVAWAARGDAAADAAADAADDAVASGLLQEVAPEPAADAVRSLARALLGRGDDAVAPLPLVRLGEELLRRAGRSPARVNGLLAALARAGHVRVRDGTVELARLDVPWDQLASAAGGAAPIDALAPAERRVARLLEAAGEPLSEGEFADLCALAGVAPAAARAALAKAGVLQTSPEGIGVRPAALPAAADERRAAARALLERERDGRRPDVELRLAVRAGDLARAARLVLERRDELARAGVDRLAAPLEELLAAAPERERAALAVAGGRLLLGAGRSTRARELFAAAAERADAAPELRREALRWLGEASLLLLRLDDARRAFAAGRPLARTPDDELPFVRGEADARMRSGDAAGALALLDAYEAKIPDLPRLQIEGLRALALLATDAVGEATRVLRRALAAARPLGEPRLVALLLTNLALAHQREGRSTAALDATREALALQEELGQLHEVALLHQNLGVYQKEARRHAEARHHFATALELRRALGDAHGVAVARANLGLLALEAGLLAEAERELAAARPLLERYGQPRERLHLELGEARLAFRLGRWRGITARLRDLRERAAAGGAREIALEAAQLLFERQLGGRRLEAAAEEFTRAEALATAAPSGRSALAMQLRRAQLRRALGEREAAQAQLAALRERARGTPLECDALLEEVAAGGPPPPLDLLEAAERAARTAQDRRALIEALLFRRAWHRARLDRHGAAACERVLRDAVAEATGLARPFAQARALLGASAARRAAHRAAATGRTTQEDEMALNLGLLRTFLAINRRLANEADLPRLLDYLVETALALAGGERGFLVLERGGQTAFEVSRSLRGGEVPAPQKELSATFLRECMESGRTLVTSNAGLDPRFRERASVAALDLRSILCVPIKVDAAARAALYLDNPLREGAFGEREVELVEALADQAGIALRNLAARREIETANAELARRVEVRDAELAMAVRDLERAGTAAAPAGRDAAAPDSGWLGASPAFVTATKLLDRLAASDLSVLLRGESGTGKERAARRLHDGSARAGRPFVSESCAAIPETLLEAECFGVRKGAFTGADRDRPGLFELARGGTLFLDEIGELPLALQAKLLRVLEERAVRPLGASAPVAVDFRLVAATNRDLRALVRDGKFREDLYFRIAVAEVELPPLRERRGDVAPLAAAFLARRNAEYGTRRAFTAPALARMDAYAWPGNVRELRNEVERAYAIADVDALDWQPPDRARETGGSLRWPEPLPTLQELERLAIVEGLARTGGDKEATARQLGISRASIYDKIRRYGLRPEPGPSRPGS